jgi:hypothetical protein
VWHLVKSCLIINQCDTQILFLAFTFIIIIIGVIVVVVVVAVVGVGWKMSCVLF